MRIFVYEYTCALAAVSSLQVEAAALNTEGAAMLRAISEDFAKIPGVELVPIEATGSEEAAFRAAARRADWCLIIAPEFGNTLAERCRWAAEEGCRCLNSSLATIELCADKLRLAEHWRARGVPTPETMAVTAETAVSLWPQWVLKPRFGAGSLDTWVNGAVRPKGEIGPMIVQRFIPGRAASVAFLCGPEQRLALPPAWQHLSADGRLEYRGGTLPLPEPWAMRANQIATRAIQSVPHLCGYVGVDLILGDDDSDWAIEINPRLTTSYLGLRQLARDNLALSLWRVACGESAGRLTWNKGPIQFHSDGTIIQPPSVVEGVA